MPVTDQFQRLSCQSIRVLRDDRQRRAINTDGLRQSIEKNGVLQPIIVRQAPGTGGDGSGGDVVLVAGERRLQACLELGLESVPVRFLDSLSPVEIQIIELDQVAAVAGIHQLYCQLDPEWSMGETADRISLAVSTVSMYIRTWTEINSPGASERLASAGGIREAYNIIMRADQREQGNALQELLDDSPVEAGTCDLQLVLPEPTPGHYDPPAPNVTYLGPKPLPPPPEEAPSCAEAGVLGVLPGIVGVLQATEVIKLILGVGQPLTGRLLAIDALDMRFREFRVPRDPECPVCGENPTITEPADYEGFCAVPLTRSAAAPPAAVAAR